MATPRYKLSRKDLKQPDEFVSVIDRVAQFTLENLPRVIIGAVAIVAMAAIGFAWSFYAQHRQRLVSDQFYQALMALGTKDYQTAEQGFSALARSHPHNNLGRLAHFYLASAYNADNLPQQARNALNDYIEVAEQPLFKQIALTQLGAIYENSGDYRKANEAYTQAAELAGPEQERARRGAARTLALQGQKQDAIAAYRRILKDNSLAPESADVVEDLADLGVSSEPAVSVKTIEVAPGNTGAAAASASKTP